MLGLAEAVGPPDGADIGLMPPTQDIAATGTLAQRLQAEGWLRPEVTGRVAFSLPSDPARQVEALRRAQRHGAAAFALCPGAPTLPPAATLSAASVYTLGVQGGPMQGAELEEITASPYAADAVRVRRWDDQAKDPQAGTPEFSHFRPLLSGLLR